MWIRDYGFDGLRLDAVHALKDNSEKHFLIELADTIRTRLVGRHVHLMLENEANQPHLLERKAVARDFTTRNGETTSTTPYMCC